MVGAAEPLAHGDRGVPHRRGRPLRRLRRRRARGPGRRSTGRCSCTSSGRRGCPALPDVDARAAATPGGRVADVGCGAGWSSIALARAYPKVRVDGFDLDAASVDDRPPQRAPRPGVDDRVRFHCERRRRCPRSRALRPRDDLRGAARHGATRSSVLREARASCSPRAAPCSSSTRASPSSFTAPGDDDRAAHVRLQRPALPARDRVAEQPSAAPARVMRPTPSASSPTAPASRTSRSSRSRTTSGASTACTPDPRLPKEHLCTVPFDPAARRTGRRPSRHPRRRVAAGDRRGGHRADAARRHAAVRRQELPRAQQRGDALGQRHDRHLRHGARRERHEPVQGLQRQPGVPSAPRVRVILGGQDDTIEYRLPHEGLVQMGDGNDTVAGGVREPPAR